MTAFFKTSALRTSASHSRVPSVTSRNGAEFRMALINLFLTWAGLALKQMKRN